MQKTKRDKKNSARLKNKTRKEIEEKLEVALASFRPLIGKKKFKKRIKKAGKILSRNLDGAGKNIEADGGIEEGDE